MAGTGSTTQDAEAGDDPIGGVSGLSLYGYPQCPFCARVLSAQAKLGIEIPLRNVLEHEEYREELLEALGRATVPVLRIEDEAGKVDWLPESADIIAYLRDRFGD